MSRNQFTIARAAEIQGEALFSGRQAKVVFRPAELGTGVMFVRTDLPDRPVAPATIQALDGGFRCTTLRWHDVEVNSVEHILSACMGLAVDNLIVDIDGPEPPASGGNAEQYAKALLDAGLEEQNAEKELLVIEEPLSVSEGDSAIVALPAEDGLTLSYLLEFESAAVPNQAVLFRLDRESYMENLAPARTFAMEGTIEQYQERSLGGGVTDENAIIVCEDGSFKKPVSGEKAVLHFPDECARHKMLDLLGDLAVVNLDIQGRIVAIRSGHVLNGAFAKRLCQAREEKKAGPEAHLDIREIQRTLPHRFPFLMVDRVLRIEEDNKIVGIKNVSVNEQFFQGHYPDYPIMPGVLQLEALAQLAGVLLLRKLEHAGKVALLVGMDGVKLRRPVCPGDQLLLEAEAVRIRSRSVQVHARGTVEGELCCEAQMMFMLVDEEAL